MIQPTLFAGPLQEQFEAFHARNPWVLDRLAELTRRLVERGHKRVGIGMLFEVLRWDWAITTDDPDTEWKLNNNYRAAYARKLMETWPQFEGIFEVRRSAFDLVTR